MQDHSQQCALCDKPATVWASLVCGDGLTRKAALCAAHADACGWLDDKSWGLLDGWNLDPVAQEAGDEPADDLLKTALAAMVESVSSITGGHFKSIAVQLQALGNEGGALKQRPGAFVESCPQCGFTLRDWKELGRLGCPSCYQAFAGRIRRQLPHLHGSTGVHWGKIPDGGEPSVSSVAYRRRIGRLRERLANAIKAEAYEEASHIRDDIREIEERMT